MLRRLLTVGLLVGFGAANVAHPVLHGLEAHPEACAVARLSSDSPSIAPSATPAVARSERQHASAAEPALVESVSRAAFPLSRGPPPA